MNGNQQNQQITLTFTDNSTVVWTQSFSDWGSPQNYGHEAVISTQSYRDTASGGTDQFTTHVYGYSYTIPSGKTLASITLPTNSNVRLLDIQMSTATSVDLSSSYSSWGIANGQTQVANNQGFDGGGYYYYSAQLGPLVAWSGATFNFGTVPTSSKGGNNFVQAKGQSITLPQGDYGWLYLAGAGANGGQTNQNLTLTFSDGSTATWTQSFSDWCSPSGYSGETIIQQQSSRVNQVGERAQPDELRVWLRLPDPGGQDTDEHHPAQQQEQRRHPRHGHDVTVLHRFSSGSSMSDAKTSGA